MIYVLVNLPITGARLYEFEATSSAEVIELARTFLQDQGLQDQINALERSDISLITAAFALNSPDHDKYFPGAESRTLDSFAEWLAEECEASAQENVLIVGIDDE